MHNKTILIIEADQSLSQFAADILTANGYKVIICSDVLSSVATLSSEPLSLVLLNVIANNKINTVDVTFTTKAITVATNAHGRANFTTQEFNVSARKEAIMAIQQVKPELPIIMITKYADFADTKKLIKLGVVDYLLTPYLPEALLNLVKRHAISVVTSAQRPVAESKVMKKILTAALRVAKSNVKILICGEQGVGKTILARCIHVGSEYCSGAFIEVNCAAHNEERLKYILFGCRVKDSVGIWQNVPGKFELASGGTLLLTEITALSPKLQSMLVGVLQEKIVTIIEGNRVVPLKCRIIATSSKDLRQEVIANNFNEDLYFALSVYSIHLPPLAARKEDIIPLANNILRDYAKKLGRQQPIIGKEAQKFLLRKTWRYNIDELKQLMYQALQVTSGEEIELKTLTSLEFDELSMVANQKPVKDGIAQQQNLVKSVEITQQRSDGGGTAS